MTQLFYLYLSIVQYCFYCNMILSSSYSYLYFYFYLFLFVIGNNSHYTNFSNCVLSSGSISISTEYKYNINHPHLLK